jgi:transcriptional regulator with XRE-family HTH domain
LIHLAAKSEEQLVAEVGARKKVGERIKAVREESGWTQEQLAERANISKSFLSDVERGERDFTSEYLLRIANALGASTDFLLRGEETPRKREDIVIPPELAEASKQLRLRWDETLDLLQAHNSVIARRTTTAIKQPSVQDWVNLHQALKNIYDGETEQ